MKNYIYHGPPTAFTLPGNPPRDVQLVPGAPVQLPSTNQLVIDLVAQELLTPAEPPAEKRPPRPARRPPGGDTNPTGET